MGTKAVAFAALMILSVLPASAQSRAGGAARTAAIRPAAAPRAVRSTAIPMRFRRPNPSTPSVGVNPAFVGGVFPGGTIQDLFGYPVPGLGFDYVNYGALNSNLGVRALIDPVTQQEIALALRLQGSGFGTAPFLFSPFGAAPIVLETPGAVAAPPDAPAPAQPPIIVVTPPATQPVAQTQLPAQEVPLPDPGEFVLVQRDGRLLFAVAFTSDPGRVVYITREGLRRSIALDQLDVDATVRMNEERGTSIQLPKA